MCYWSFEILGRSLITKSSWSKSVFIWKYFHHSILLYLVSWILVLKAARELVTSKQNLSPSPLWGRLLVRCVCFCRREFSGSRALQHLMCRRMPDLWLECSFLRVWTGLSEPSPISHLASFSLRACRQFHVWNGTNWHWRKIWRMKQLCVLEIQPWAFGGGRSYLFYGRPLW